VSNIIIISETRDLAEWLEEHGAKIVLRLTNNGWYADFAGHFSYVGPRMSVPCTGADTNLERQIKAVRSLLWSLRGCRVGFDAKGPSTIEVPEFTGIEEAVKNAVRAPRV
jgi:hypothetical protein